MCPTLNFELTQKDFSNIDRKNPKEIVNSLKKESNKDVM